MDNQPEPVTIVIAQRIKPGREADYEAWTSEITQVASAYPGHLGVNVIRPQPGFRPEYVTIFRFNCYDNLKTWLQSRDRADWLARLQPLIADTPQIQQISGIEAWFSLPGKPLATPPRYKMALLTLGVVYVLISLLNQLLVPQLQGWPAWLASLLVSGIMVVLMTYAVMPLVTQLFAKWLYPKR